MRHTGDPLECRLAGGGSYNMLPEGEPVGRRLHEITAANNAPPKWFLAYITTCVLG